MFDDWIHLNSMTASDSGDNKSSSEDNEGSRYWNQIGISAKALNPKTEKSELTNNKKYKKLIIGSLFLIGTISVFYGFLDAAPAGIFSNLATEYTLNYSSARSSPPDEVVVNVSTSTNYGDGESGIGIESGGVTPFKLIFWSFILYIFTVVGYKISKRWGKFVKINISTEDKTQNFELSNRIVSCAIATGFYLFGAIILYMSPFFINGDLDPNRINIRLFTLGVAVHLLFVYALLYEYSRPVYPSPKPCDWEIYMQKEGQVAQGILSLGLAVGIGGVLTFARAGTRLAIPTLLIVGIVLFPLSGIAAYRYYRIREIEYKFNR